MLLLCLVFMMMITWVNETGERAKKNIKHNKSNVSRSKQTKFECLYINYLQFCIYFVSIKKSKNSASRDHDKSVLEKITSSHKNASKSSSSKTNTSDEESRCFRENANMARDLRRATENMLCTVFISRIHCLVQHDIIPTARQTGL